MQEFAVCLLKHVSIALSMCVICDQAFFHSTKKERLIARLLEQWKLDFSCNLACKKCLCSFLKQGLLLKKIISHIVIKTI